MPRSMNLRTEGGEEIGDDHQHHAEDILAPVGPEIGQEGPQLVHDRVECHRVAGPLQVTPSRRRRCRESMLAALTLLAVAACGRGDKRDVASADSLSRDLQLAPVDTTAPLNDRPSADTARRGGTAPAPAPGPPQAGGQAEAQAQAQAQAAAPAPTPRRPVAGAGPLAGRRPRAALPRAPASPPRPTRRFGRTRTRWVTRSRPPSASDVKDASGHVVIPAGAKVTLAVTAIKESENKGDTTGTLTLKPTSISINGTSQPLPRPSPVCKHQAAGRGTNAGDIAKVGAGTAVGGDRGPGDRREHQGRHHRWRHRRRGRHPAGGRDQGPRRGGAGGNDGDADAG